MRLVSLPLVLLFALSTGCGGRQPLLEPQFVEAWGAGGITVEWFGVQMSFETYLEATPEGNERTICFSFGPKDWCSTGGSGDVEGSGDVTTP
jgi:hypothetical protein